MIGHKVFHNVFGYGTITAKEGTLITVDFGGTAKKFVYPDAFERFLVSTDQAFMSRVKSDMQKKLDQQINVTTPVMTTHSVHQKLKGLKKNKKVARSNIAFKCNYCDGGKSVSRIGFYGVCSDVILRYNIESAQHVWCTDRDCPCRNYLDGHISRAELENMMEGGAGLDSVCYESHMLRDWMASAGVIQNGPDRGKPRRLMKVQKNSLAVLTTRDPNSPEDTRYIFAVFLVDDSYEGDHKDAGYVTTFSSWKIELSPQEARKMKFWTYYANSNRDVIAFSSGLFRYLSNNQAAQILRDIKEIRATAKDREFAEHFLEHFCKINGISVTEIPTPSGALIKK